MPLNSLLQALRFKPASEAVAPLRLVLVGAGRMGQYHLKHLSRRRDVALAGIVDSNGEHARRLARKYRTTAGGPSEFLENVDAAIIASPTPTHFSLGKLFLEAGVSCLIEKPLASTVEEAEALIELSAQNGCILQVGHIERFNPAILEAARHIRNPKFIEVNRLGPYDPRVADVGVVLDLMIHDLDMVLFLVGRPVTRVEAFGAKVLSSHEDIAKVRLHFEGGCIADLSASRISLKKYRRIRIFQENAYLTLDYAAPKLLVYSKKAARVQSLKDIAVLKPSLRRTDALALELDHFLQCVKTKKAPVVGGEHGRDALRLAQEVLAALRVHE